MMMRPADCSHQLKSDVSHMHLDLAESRHTVMGTSLTNEVTVDTPVCQVKSSRVESSQVESSQVEPSHVKPSEVK